MSDLKTKSDYKNYKLELHRQMLGYWIISEFLGGIQNIGTWMKKALRLKGRPIYLIL